jgi:serine phosphatase RsbU (regulator of sigma subunit)
MLQYIYIIRLFSSGSIGFPLIPFFAPGNNGYFTPYHFIMYSAIIISLVYFLIMGQTRLLIRIKRLLREKEEALLKIENQNAELVSRNKSVTDSLNYAQRIQEALLPSEQYFKGYFRESFIFYKPKDIVSGDFYWLGESDRYIFVIAADCTGHGVPGALMSMIGHEMLDKIINVDKVEEPAKILDIMSAGLEKIFSREKNAGLVIKDGMDIGICAVDREKRKIKFAGAFFSLYLIRDNRLLSLDGDKYPLGMTLNLKIFSNKEMDLIDDDILYLFSDGYVDQFGGSDNKKFMYRRFRYLLMTIYKFPVADQKAILEENIRTWMGTTPQIDDMLIIGFKPFTKV